MALKRRNNKGRHLSYQAKLFIPIIGIMWLMIIGFSVIQYNREKSYREEFLRNRIDILNHRFLDLYETGQDPSYYLTFLEKYFENTVFEGMSMNIYDTETGELLYGIGAPAPPPSSWEVTDNGGQIKSYNVNGSKGETIQLNPTTAFYYNIDVSDDGRILVQTLLPNDARVLSEVSRTTWWWWFVIACCLTVTLMAWLATRHLTNNIKLLRNFAETASTDLDFVTIDKFSNDELGDISRQIVNIYNSRKAALASRELEHQVVLKATEERNTMRRQLTNNINHEMKTPATIIKGYLDTIVDNPDMDPDSTRHFITKAQAQIDRLCSILNDLSTMTRLEESSQNIPLERLDFHKFVADLATDVEESGIGGEMIFYNDVPEDIYVKANASLLGAALMNLVKNAAAYSHGTEMGIRLLTKSKRYYTFIFFDDGQGVAEEHLPMIFERFYRVDKGRSRKAGGTGLGLAIVRSSFNTMGGSISVRNADTHGLEFVFTLPIAQQG